MPCDQVGNCLHEFRRSFAPLQPLSIKAQRPLGRFFPGKYPGAESKRYSVVLNPDNEKAIAQIATSSVLEMLDWMSIRLQYRCRFSFAVPVDRAGAMQWLR